MTDRAVPTNDGVIDQATSGFNTAWFRFIEILKGAVLKSDFTSVDTLSGAQTNDELRDKLNEVINAIKS